MLDGEAVLIDLERGTALGLNPSGSFLWARLATHDTDELAREMASAFEVAPDQARADVASFIDSLRTRGFVENVPPDDTGARS
jgi:hypothetical protein